MSSVQIDQSRCCGDELCVSVCPSGCLRMKNGKAALVPLGEKMCLECGQCSAVCPRAAISLNGQEPVQPDGCLPSVSDTAHLIKTRRSVRNFKPDPVPRPLLAQALEVVRYAPTGKNRQDICWLGLDDRQKLDELIKRVIDFMRGVPEAQRVVKAFDRGGDPILRGAPCALFAHASIDYHLSSADCSLATGYLDLLLHSMGLGACWAGFVVGAASKDPSIRCFLGIPEGRAIFAGLMVGYPSFKYRFIPPRKPVNVSWL